MQKIGYKDIRALVYRLLRQTKSLSAKVALWPLYTSSMFEKKNLKRQVLLQAGWSKIFTRI